MKLARLRQVTNLRNAVLVAVILLGFAGAGGYEVASARGTGAPVVRAGGGWCTPGQIGLAPTIPNHSHILLTAVNWTFGWSRTNGCKPVRYYLHENLIKSRTPGGNPQAHRFEHFVVTSSSAVTGQSSMKLLSAAEIDGTFWGCEQLDVQVITESGKDLVAGELINAPGADPQCQPLPPSPPPDPVPHCQGGPPPYPHPHSLADYPPQPCELLMSRYTLRGGTTVSAIGIGFNSHVTVHLNFGPPAQSLGTTSTDRSGIFVVPITIPAGTPAGRYLLMATGQSGKHTVTLETSFFVVEPGWHGGSTTTGGAQTVVATPLTLSATPRTVGTGALASFTQAMSPAGAAVVAILAVNLLSGGTWFVLSGRRRRRSAART